MEAKQKMLTVPLSKIVQIENTRGDNKTAGVNELMQSMKQHGQLQPIGVRPGPEQGTYDVVFGNRRVFAAQKLGWETLDAVIAGTAGTKESDIDFIIKNATENMQRVDPSFAEQGRLSHSLIRKGLTTKEISIRIGVSQDRVRKIIDAFEDVPKHLRDAVILNQAGASRAGSISLATTTAILNSAKTYELPEGARTKIFDYAKKKGLSPSKATQMVRLMANNVSLDKAASYLGSVKVVSVNFLFTEAVITAAEKKYGKKIKEAIYDFVAGSGEFPLARIAPKVVVRKKSS